MVKIHELCLLCSFGGKISEVVPTNALHKYKVAQTNAPTCTNVRISAGRLSSTGSEILTFDSHCSANFQPILDCFIPKFELEYDNLENIKTDSVDTVILNFHQIKRFKFFFWDTRYIYIVKIPVKGPLIDCCLAMA